MLEEPASGKFYSMLRGLIDPRSYIESLYIEFTRYAELQYALLRELTQSRHVLILQVEPYLTKLVEIYRAIEENSLHTLLTRDKLALYVHKIENYVSEKLLEYYTCVYKGDFREVVNRVIEFARRDAYRIFIRDVLRAHIMSKLVRALKKRFRKCKIVVEAGIIHTYLPIALRRFLSKNEVRINVVNLKLEIYRELNLRPLPHPGDLLTQHFLHGKVVGKDKLKLLAARAVVYTMLIRKTEAKPEVQEHVRYPHILQEYKVLSLVNKLSFEDCKKMYEIFWRRVIRRGS